MKALLTTRLVLFVNALLILCLVSTKVFGSEIYTPHYAFSNYFGAGLYSSTGQNITVFNMPFDYEPDQVGENRFRIRLPISLGFYNFELDNIDEIKPFKDAATITLTLGIEFDHWVNPQLKLVPFLDIGFNENFSGKDRAAIYASGIGAYNYFSAWDQDHSWLIRVQRAGYRTQDSAISDGFSSLELGIDLTLPWQTTWLNHEMYFSQYAVAYWYALDIAFDPASNNPPSENHAQELGLTLGFRKPIDFKIFSLDRLGLGYRYSSKSPDIIRLTINFPLD